MVINKKQLLEIIKEIISEESKQLPTNFFKVGDKVLFGKYKNKKGTITGFGKDDKGNPTVKIKPTVKDGGKKKKDQEIGLYRIWDGEEKPKDQNDKS